MSSSHYFYFTLPVIDLESLVENHRKEFDTFLEDNFSDEEIQDYEKMLDSIAAIWVQPILDELQFDDFYCEENEEERQRAFFESCRSSISLENIPYLESNPFQVTYLKMLLSRFGEVLIDRGGIFKLQFKESYLKDLDHYKTVDDLLYIPKTTEVRAQTTLPVDPIDFLVLDVYKELERLNLGGKAKEIEEIIKGHNQKVQKLYLTLTKGRFDASLLYQKSGLAPKDFDDNLEKIKFILRKL